LDISSGNTISIRLPLDPAFDREKDLVSPLHMMIERADLTGCELSLIDMRMVGAVKGAARLNETLERVMSSVLTDGHLVSRGEGVSSWVHFFLGKCSGDIDEIMKSISDRFLEACRESGEQMIPSLRWETRYSRLSEECPSDAEILNI
jgi:hypothetical protein